MAIKNEDLRLNMIINGDDGRHKIIEIQKKIDETRQRLQKLNQEPVVNQKSISAARGQLSKYTKDLEVARRQLHVNSMTIAELASHSKNLNAILRQTDPKSPLWQRLNMELKETNQRLKELRSGAQTAGSAMVSLHHVTTTFAAGLSIYNRLKGLLEKNTSAFVEFDAAVTAAMKTTGLSREKMLEVSKALDSIDTRTSKEQLLGLVEIGGKLGVEGVENLTQFANASDKIVVALGKYLGGNAEAAVTAIGKLVDIFSLRQEYGLEEAILKTGSAIGKLGLSSTACEGYLVDFTSRLAGIAPMADISIDKVLGIAAALDVNAQSAQTSATAIGQMLIKMFEKTDVFAKVAAMSVKDFSDLLSTDVNAAMLAVFKGMRDNSEGIGQVVEALGEVNMKGARSSQVLAAMAEHYDELVRQQEIASVAFAEGTAVVDEFNTMNSSTEAKIEKLKNAIHEQAVEIGEKLTPAYLASLASSRNFLSVISNLISSVAKYSLQIAKVSAFIATLVTWQKTEVIWTKVVAAAKKLATFWSVANRNALYEETLEMKANVAAGKRVSAGHILMQGTALLLTGQLKAAGTAFRLLNATMKANPIGAVLTALSAIVAVVGFFRKKNKEAADSVEDLTAKTKRLAGGSVEAKSKIDQETRSLEELKKEVLSAKKGSKERADAIKKLNDKYGDYLPRLITEKDSNKDIAAALKDVNTQLERKFYLEAMESDLNEVRQKGIDNQKEALAGLGDVIGDDADAQAEVMKLLSDYNKALKEGSDATEEYAALREKLLAPTKARHQEQKASMVQTARKAATNEYNPYSETEMVAFAEKNADRMFQPVYDAVDAKLAEFKQQALENVKDENFVNQFYSNLITPSAPAATSGSGSGGGFGDDDKGKKTWSLESDEEFLKKKAELTRKYNAGEIKTREEYSEQLYQLEVRSIEDRLALNKEKGADRAKLEADLQSRMMKHYEETVKLEQDGQKLISASNTERSAKEQALVDAEEQRYSAEKAKYEARKNDLKNYQQIVEALERQHQVNLQKIRNDALSAELQEMETEHKQKLEEMKAANARELSLNSTSSARKMEIRRNETLAAAKENYRYLSDLHNKLATIVSDGKIGDVILSEDQKKAFLLRLTEVKKQLGEADAALQNIDGPTTLRTIFQGTGGSLFGVSQEAWNQFFERLEEGKLKAEDLGNALNAIGGMAEEGFKLAQTALSMTAAKEKKEYNDWKKKNDAKQVELQKRYDAGLMTEAQYNASKEQMEADAEAKQEEMELKQARRAKALSVAESIIQTSLSVMKTFTGWGGWPYGVAPAAIMAAIGAAQTAMITATPVTGAAEGGEIMVERAQDGKKYKAVFDPGKRGAIDKPTVLVGEDGPEYVIPAEGVRNPSLAPILRTIEAARQRGMLRNINFDAAYPARGFAPGGATGQMQSTSHNQDNSELVAMLKKLSKRLDTPIEAYTTMTGKNGFVETYERYKRNKARSGQLG